MISSRLITLFSILAGLQFILALVVFTIFSRSNPIVHAVFCMGLGLFILWIIIFGCITWKYKERIRSFVMRIPVNWAVKFVIFCTLLALAEEAITTTMTNLAPWFGVPIGTAYITASANYLTVVLGHSVILLVPIFIAWAFLLSRYDFKPNHVFLLFGLIGTCGEVLYGGPKHFLEIGMWTYVYGLMVYLPAYCLPERQTKPLQPYHYLLPFIYAILFQILLLPIIPLIRYIRPSVTQSFPPMRTK